MMPEYEVYVNGKPKKIELTRSEDYSYSAKIDGKPRTFSAPKNALAGNKPFTIKLDGKPYQIRIVKIDQPKEISITVDKTTFKTEVRIPARKVAFAAFEPTTTVTRRAVANKQILEGAINAPMTGKIVSIKVSKGDSVKINQVLCVIEAMKMENEITASKAGTVKEVLVIVGSPVSEGDPLVVIV
jgi:biotin carboxyl carrier protein